MKIYRFYVAVAIMALSTSVLKAQSLSDIVSSISVTDVVTSVTGGSSLTTDNVVGEWDYVSTAVELSSDSILTSAAGAVATSQVEAKLDDVCSKVGIKEGAFAFVFNEDMTFTSNVGSKNLGGSYTLDSSSSEITLNYSAYSTISIGKLTASVTLLGDSMSILFPADNLLKLLSALSSISSNESLELLSSLADQYDGIKLGFELEGETTATESTTSTAVEAAASALSKWF